MRKAICQYSFHRTYEQRKWTPDRFAAQVAALGIEGIDFHVRYLDDPDTAAGQISRAVEDHGLVLAGLSMSNDLNKENDVAFQDEIDAVKRWIAVAAQVQAPVSRIFGGHLEQQHRNDRVLADRARRRITSGLEQLAAEAEKLAVVLGLENHGGLPCLAQQQIEVIRQVNSPCLKATIDVGNYMEGGQEGHVATGLVAEHAVYVHFKDFRKIPCNENPWGWKPQACVLGEGDVDHAACLLALEQAGYGGFVALEYEAEEDELLGVPRSVQYMNQCL